MLSINPLLPVSPRFVSVFFMATTIPAGGQVPWNEPVRSLPTNPAEVAELEQILIANHWNQWHYKGRCLYSRNPDGTEKLVQISGIDVGMLYARRQNLLGSWPMPGEYGVGTWPYGIPANCALNPNGTPAVQQYPT